MTFLKNSNQVQNIYSYMNKSFFSFYRVMFVLKTRNCNDKKYLEYQDVAETYFSK